MALFTYSYVVDKDMSMNFKEIKFTYIYTYILAVIIIRSKTSNYSEKLVNFPRYK